MKQKSFLLTLILALFVLTSCNLSKSGKGSKHSGGKTNEIMAVTNTDVMWRGLIGDTITQFFGSIREGLPQPEPMFTIAFTNVKQFESTKLLKKHHNVFIANIDADLPKSFIETKKNLWAIPQRVVKINAKNEEEFFLLFNEYKESFLQLFDELEIERTQKTMKLGQDLTLSNNLAKKFGFSLLIPAGFQVVNEDRNHAYLRQSITKAKQDLIVGLLIYQYPYKDTLSFTPERIIAMRDSVCKKYVPGPTDSSYMITSVDVIPPVFAATGSFIDGYAVETSGLWALEGDFMGGPFLSYSFVNERTQMFVTIEGFVYNPNNKKGVYLRQLEAMMKSIAFSEN